MNKLINKIGGKRLIIWSIILLILALALRFYNYTNIFRDIDITKENYLSFNDYLLLDYEDSEVKTNTEDLTYQYAYDFYNRNGEKPYYKTTKNISVGSTLEEFLNAYGNYYAQSISAYEPDYKGERDDKYYELHYIHKPMLVNDYYRDYIQGNLLDINKNEITFNFKICIKGSDVAFTEREVDIMYDKHYGSLWPSGSVFNPKVQEYCLSFTFQMIDNVYLINHISTDRYVY